MHSQIRCLFSGTNIYTQKQASAKFDFLAAPIRIVSFLSHHFLFLVANIITHSTFVKKSTAVWLYGPCNTLLMIHTCVFAFLISVCEQNIFHLVPLSFGYKSRFCQYPPCNKCATYRNNNMNNKQCPMY